MRSRALLVLFTLSLALTTAAVAQPPPVIYSAVALPGGAGNFVRGLVQDRQGFLWVGLWKGLLRYDGYDFVPYRHDSSNTSSLSSDRVECLYVDREGTLWARHPREGSTASIRQPAPSCTFATTPRTRRASARTRSPSSWRIGKGYFGSARMEGYWMARQRGTFTRYVHNPKDPKSLSHDRVRALYRLPCRYALGWYRQPLGIIAREGRTQSV